MGTNRVKIVPTAKADLQEVVDYLNTLSPEAARKYYDLLVAEIASLSEMPERCSPVRDLVLIAKGYRVRIVKNYLVFFMVAGDTVQIHRILYGKRDYQAFL